MGARSWPMADEAALRALVNLEIGTDVQAYSATLTSWAGITRATKLDASAYTAADVLAKLLTVDGVGSGSTPICSMASHRPTTRTSPRASATHELEQRRLADDLHAGDPRWRRWCTGRHQRTCRAVSMRHSPILMVWPSCFRLRMA